MGDVAMPRWLDWLTYSRDPELHRKLDALVDRLAKSAPMPFDAKPAPQARRHDCGHESTSYATDGNGTTQCRSCYDHRMSLVRNKAPRA